jgi:hypothetical protein
MDDEVNALMGAADEAIWRQRSFHLCRYGKGLTSALMSSRKRLRPKLHLLLWKSVRLIVVTLPPDCKRFGVWELLRKNLLNVQVLLGRIQGCRRVVKGGCLGGCLEVFQRERRLDTGPRRYKHWIPNRSKRKLMLGEDIGLEDMVSLALCTLVGRFSYWARCKMPLEEWVSTNWCPLLGYKPEVVFLTKGWFGFHFKRMEDSEMILEKAWSYDGGSLMLKRWRVSFRSFS